MLCGHWVASAKNSDFWIRNTKNSLVFSGALNFDFSVSRMYGCLDVWFLWLVGWLANWLFGLLVGCKIHQAGCRKSFKLALKSTKLELKIVKNCSQEASWRGLGGSCGGLGGLLGPRGHQDRKMLPNRKVGFPDWGPSWRPKSTKNRSWGDPKGDHFFDWLLDRFLERFGAILAPSWPPKPSQNGAKLAPKSTQVGVLIWELFLEGCWQHVYQFSTTWYGRSSYKYAKTEGILTFLIFGCCVVGMICWLMFDWFLVDFGMGNRPTIYQKSIK